MLKKLILSGCAFCFAAITIAQNKATQGDIVEIFGKERTERVDEGEVAYKFTDGYFLPNSVQNGYFFQNRDVIAWELLDDNFVAPTPDNLTATNYGRTRENIQWTPISVDEKGAFKDRGLRNAYLYSEYNSPKEEVLLLQSTANMRSFINGMPHEGDYYDFAYTLIPFKAKKGVNQFVFTPGRYGYVEGSIIRPDQPVMFSKRDMTLCNLIIGETDEKWAAIRVVNSSSKTIKGLTIKCELETGEVATYKTGDVMDMSTRKLPYLVPASKSTEEGKIKATLTLTDAKGKVIDTAELEYRNADSGKVNERTFVSKIDGSVQYFSLKPSLTKGEGQALFLSVHGASVEARNQARAYAAKDWGHIVCPTNRRPFGYNWEDVGRKDAIEVLEVARELLKTDPQKTYLTGHSMGGHGTWHIGVTYPDKFAAIAPCASYPDIADYGMNKLDTENKTIEQFSMVQRAAHAGRTKSLKRNYLQSGVYILHGDADKVVPIDLVRDMRQILATYHPDVAWYEYPGGSHWYSNESVDWKPIFDYYKWHTIPATKDVKHIEFWTASPGVSASNYWATIAQQLEPYNYSNIVLDVVNDSIVGKTENVSVLKFDFNNMPVSGATVIAIDGSNFTVDGKDVVTIRKENGTWKQSELNAFEKSDVRAGNFKDVFDNNVVFVYSTAGSKVENEWYKNKARYDAETMLYRGNGSIEVVSDVEFLKGDFSCRNVMIYGNSKTNKAWNSLLVDCPIKVTGTAIELGDKTFTGDDYATYFVYPRSGCSKTLVGVVAGTGIKGARATYPNDYMLANTGFPDVMVFNFDMLRDGLRNVSLGFFDNNWSLENSEFVFAQ
ncbi:MAG: prolyl oligopeptidase family serine peptidase [Rikenellaceae bacterium]